MQGFFAMIKKLTRRELRRRAGLARSLVAGLGSLLTIAAPAHAATHLDRSSAASGLQGDFNRIGSDMRIATIREKRREEAAS